MKSTKTMLIAALAAGALLAGGSSLLAQDSTNAAPAVKHAQGGMAALNLTDDQKPKFQAIMKDTMDKRKALRDDTTLSADDKKAKMTAIQDDQATQMKALLTPEQFTKWQAMAKKMKGKRPAASGDAPAAAPAPAAQN